VIRACLHTHSTLCDGRAPLEDYPEAALSAGLSVLGFSGHSPVPYKNDWTMKMEALDEYVDRVNTLKTIWKGRLEILLGMELDWMPEAADWFIPRPDVAGFDYRIGSVHSIMDPADDLFYAVDGPEEQLVHLIEKVCGGSVRRLVEAYAERLVSMIRHGGFEILGHVDLVRKRNRNDKYFSEDQPWYRQAFGTVLEELSSRPVVTEVNTGAMARGYLDTPYPSLWFLKELKKRKLPVMINADAHEPGKLDFGYTLAGQLLIEAGFREIRLLSEGKWQDFPLGEV
jgi:histidinol-phosphatase (PHP family)